MRYFNYEPEYLGDPIGDFSETYDSSEGGFLRSRKLCRIISMGIKRLSVVFASLFVLRLMLIDMTDHL
jgi:hypothetical protein